MAITPHYLFDKRKAKMARMIETVITSALIIASVCYISVCYIVNFWMVGCIPIYFRTNRDKIVNLQTDIDTFNVYECHDLPFDYIVKNNGIGGILVMCLPVMLINRLLKKSSIEQDTKYKIHYLFLNNKIITRR